MMMKFLSAGLLVSSAFSPLALAQDNDSAYVQVFENCVESSLKDEPVWYLDCPGYGDWTVHIISGEHGAAVAYSERGKDQQWTENPPRIAVFQDLGEVIEWRLDADGREFATIYRSIFSGFEPGQGGQYLTVTALREDGPVGGCHVAYIEAAVQPGANQIARDAADFLAPDWQCGAEGPIVFDLESEFDVLTIAAQRMPGH